MIISSDMVPAPIVIKLPVQTKRLVAAAGCVPVDNTMTNHARKAVIVDQRSNVVTLYDSKIAERTPIEEVSFLTKILKLVKLKILCFSSFCPYII